MDFSDFTDFVVTDADGSELQLARRTALLERSAEEPSGPREVFTR